MYEILSHGCSFLGRFYLDIEKKKRGVRQKQPEVMYAHSDDDLRGELIDHLSNLQRQQVIYGLTMR